MIRTILTVGFAAATGFAGWLGGSLYPAPPEWTDTINREANDVRAQLRLRELDLKDLRKMLPGQKLNQLAQEAEEAAAAAGQVIQVDRNVGSLDDQLNNLAISEASLKAAEAPPPAPAGATGFAALFDANLALCPKMKIENAPGADAKGVVSQYQQQVDVKGAKLAMNPTRGACLSSGFGSRDMRLHKGVDFHSDVGGPILAAGDGKIIEMKYRDDYGNMVLIDHGKGVYTRYAHLASFGRGLTSGVTVKAGEQIGLMGNTAAYPVPMHLHYEVLTGDYANPKASFGLEPVNVFMAK